MVDRKILIIAAFLGVAAVLIYFRDFRKSPTPVHVGQNIESIFSIPLIACDEIMISKDDKKLSLRLNPDKIWEITEPSGPTLATNAEMLLRLMDQLAVSKFQMLLTKERDQWAEFGLKEPISITFKSQGKEAASLYLGNYRPKGSEQYIRFNDQDEVYLLSQGLYLPIGIEAWENKSLSPFNPEEIKEVSFTPSSGKGKNPVKLARDQKQDSLQIKDLPPEKKVNQNAQNLQDSLSKLNFFKRLDSSNEPAQTALASSEQQVEILLFDGTKTTFKVALGGSEGEKNYVKLDSSDPKINRFLAGWFFEVDRQVAETLSKGLEDFLLGESSP